MSLSLDDPIHYLNDKNEEVEATFIKFIETVNEEGEAERIVNAEIAVAGGKEIVLVSRLKHAESPGLIDYQIERAGMATNAQEESADEQEVP